MIKDVKALPLTSIFTRDKKWFYRIPIYQRAYTWSQSEWNLLFNDVLENESGYFLGSMICINDSKSALADNVDFLVIDGQQRLTSLSLLLLAIYDKLNVNRNSLKENQIDKLNDLRKEILQLVDDETDEYAPRLTLQNTENNNDDYLSLLSEKLRLILRPKQKNAGNRRIYRAFKCFTKYIGNFVCEESKNSPNKTEAKILFDLAEKINSTVLVFIEVDSNKDAYTLFESLNHRGIPLSPIDLLKNYLISVADDRRDAKKPRKAYEKWEKIIGYLGDNYADQERFLRQYYNAFREEINAPLREENGTAYPVGYLATKSTLIDIYERLIKRDYNAILDDLSEKSRIYSILINRAAEEDEIEELKSSLLDLERIQGAPSYILLLYAVSNMQKLSLTYGDVNSIVNYLVKFFVRRNLTDYPNTRNLTKIFMDTIALVRDGDGTDAVKKICEKLKSVSSNDKDFEDRLRDDVYVNNVDGTRFLLCYYENKFFTKETRKNLWERDKNNKYIFTIEHVFPEGENVPAAWVAMIAGGDAQKASLLRSQYTHKLGNLTITGYNQNLGAMSFEDKKELKKDGAYIGYKNGLKLNEHIANKTRWTAQDISDRTDRLVEFFKNEFKL